MFGFYAYYLNSSVHSASVLEMNYLLFKNNCPCFGISLVLLNLGIITQDFSSVNLITLKKERENSGPYICLIFCQTEYLVIKLRLQISITTLGSEKDS